MTVKGEHEPEDKYLGKECEELHCLQFPAHAEQSEEDDQTVNEWFE